MDYRGLCAAAQEIGVHRRTLANWVKQKRCPIPYFMAGNRVQFAKADVERYKESRRITAAKPAPEAVSSDLEDSKTRALLLASFLEKLANQCRNYGELGESSCESEAGRATAWTTATALTIQRLRNEIEAYELNGGHGQYGQ